jgi:hypothetical protein
VAAVNIKAFRGTIPRVGSRLLQPNQASVADNCKITSGNLEPLSLPQLVHTSTLPAIQTAYYWRSVISGFAQENWLVWDAEVSVVKSLVANDTRQRIYFASPSFEPRISTYELAIGSAPYPTAWYALGVTPPTTALTAGVTGGSGTLETRFYTYTYVTQFGEESPPAPPSAGTIGYPNGTWSLSGMQTAPPNTGSVSAAASIGGQQVDVTLNTVFGITQFDLITFASVGGMTDLNGTFRVQAVNTGTNKVTVNLDTAQTYTSGGSWARTAPHNTSGMTKRIYRTVGAGGSFLFVAEIAVATTTYTDAVVADSLGETLPTADSQLPPKNLISLISLPNGCLAGIAGNELCFSDPYQPYSWPIRNRYTFSGVGVSIIAAGNSVILLTDSFPILFTGSDPEVMSPSVMQTYAPCVSRRGVVDVGGGCLYPSFDGLWIAAPGRVEKLTQALYRKEEWADLYPQTFTAGFVDGQYYARYVNADNESFIWVFDTAQNDSVVRVEQSASSLFRNEADGALYLSLGNKVYRWDSSPTGRYISDWVSSEVQLPRPMNFSVAQVHAGFSVIVPPDETILENNTAIYSDVDLVGGALNADEFLVHQVNGSALGPYEQATPDKVQFSLYADDNIVFSREVTTANPFRLPAGFVAEVYKIGLSSTLPVYNVTIAQSVAELAETST